MKLFVLVVCVLVASVQGDEDDMETTTAGDIIADELTNNNKTLGPPGIKAKVRAFDNSGKLEISASDNFDEENTVSVQLHSIREFSRSRKGPRGEEAPEDEDNDGTPPGDSEEGDDDSFEELDGKRHSFNSFAKQRFAFTPLIESDTYEGLNVTSISFSTEMKKNISNDVVILGNVSLEIYIFKESGNLSIDGEYTAVYPGSVKVNLVLNRFDFCSNETENCGNRTAAGIDVILRVKGKGGKKAERAKKRPGEAGDVYILGDKTALRMSKKIKTGEGEYTNMAEGYPKLETKGGKSLIKCRFLKFADMAVYDPMFDLNLDSLVAVDDNDDDGDNDGGDSVGGHASFVQVSASMCLFFVISKLAL